MTVISYIVFYSLNTVSNIPSKLIGKNLAEGFLHDA